jgi:hypothetical protein
MICGLGAVFEEGVAETRPLDLGDAHQTLGGEEFH